MQHLRYQQQKIYYTGQEPMAREPDVALLMTAPASLDIFLTRFLRMRHFLQFSIYNTTKSSAIPCSTWSRINSKKYVIKTIIHTLPMLILLKNAQVSKLVAFCVEKYHMALTETKSKIYRFHGSSAKKVPDPWSTGTFSEHSFLTTTRSELRIRKKKKRNAILWMEADCYW